MYDGRSKALISSFRHSASLRLQASYRRKGDEAAGCDPANLFAAEFTLQETQKALRLYRMDTLYARDPRDALLMTCFNMRQGSLSDLNELLVGNGFEALRSSGRQEEG